MKLKNVEIDLMDRVNSAKKELLQLLALVLIINEMHELPEVPKNWLRLQRAKLGFE